MDKIVGITFLSCIVLVAVGQQINIDGQWSPWSNIETPCHDPNDESKIIYCGGGVRRRFRSCTNPTKQGAGQDCQGTSEKMDNCNTHACQLPGDYLWGEWSKCSTTCGRGVRIRHTMCGSVRLKANAKSSTDMELEYQEPCQANQVNSTTEPCNTWNPSTCPSPCQRVKCPQFSKCKDISTAEDPIYTCECKLGTVLSDDNSTCINPPPPPPTLRPIPTLPAAQKTAANVMTRGASTLIIIFLSITLGLFILLRIFDTSRVIHMNMELALLMAHVCLMPVLHGQDTNQWCTIFSILTNYFFLACFMFMFLESIHMYAMVAWVVHRDGLLSRMQNVIMGWGCAFVIILFCMCFEYDSFGGEYHCFLRLDSGLMYGIYVPIIVLVIVTFAIVEAAGASEYKKLEKQDENQRTTAKIMQRTLLFILPLVFVSFILGTLAEFEQNLYLYSIFTLVNGVLGAIIFFFHSTADERVREMLKKVKRKLCPGKEK